MNLQLINPHIYVCSFYMYSNLSSSGSLSFRSGSELGKTRNWANYCSPFKAKSADLVKDPLETEKNSSKRNFLSYLVGKVQYQYICVVLYFPFKECDVKRLERFICQFQHVRGESLHKPRWCHVKVHVSWQYGYYVTHLVTFRNPVTSTRLTVRAITAHSPEFSGKIISRILLMSSLRFLPNYLSIISTETVIERPKATFLRYNCKRRDWSF